MFVYEQLVKSDRLSWRQYTIGRVHAIFGALDVTCVGDSLNDVFGPFKVTVICIIHTEEESVERFVVFIAVRVRSMTEGYVFTGVCLLTWGVTPVSGLRSLPSLCSHVLPWGCLSLWSHVPSGGVPVLSEVLLGVHPAPVTGLAQGVPQDIPPPILPGLDFPRRRTFLFHF